MVRIDQACIIVRPPSTIFVFFVLRVLGPAPSASIFAAARPSARLRPPGRAWE